jgi:hypothetical protein
MTLRDRFKIIRNMEEYTAKVMGKIGNVPARKKADTSQTYL